MLPNIHVVFGQVKSDSFDKLIRESEARAEALPSLPESNGLKLIGPSAILEF